MQASGLFMKQQSTLHVIICTEDDSACSAVPTECSEMGVMPVIPTQSQWAETQESAFQLSGPELPWSSHRSGGQPARGNVLWSHRIMKAPSNSAEPLWSSLPLVAWQSLLHLGELMSPPSFLQPHLSLGSQAPRPLCSLHLSVLSSRSPPLCLLNTRSA